MKNIGKQIFIYILIVIIIGNIYVNNNIYNNLNRDFNTFQLDSDGLVVGKLLTNEKNLPKGYYGLYRVANLVSKADGEFDILYDRPFIIHINGYFENINSICFSRNLYTDKYLIAGNMVLFETGITHKIKSVDIYDTEVYVYFNEENEINFEKCGNLFNAKILDSNGNNIPNLENWAYTSSVGIQGYIAEMISKIIPDKKVPELLKYVYCMLMAVCVLVLTIILKHKYNRLLANSFFATFLLSPWVANFAKSIYWLEFTWLIPLIFGLLISMYGLKKDRKTVLLL